MSKLEILSIEEVEQSELIVTLKHTYGFIFKETFEFKVRGNPDYDEWYYYPLGHVLEDKLIQKLSNLLEKEREVMRQKVKELERLARVKRWNNE
jgi:hypothetical protein